MKKIINYHIKNEKNIGDLMCAPAHYFDIGKTLDIRDDEKSSVAIFGGGAISSSVRKYFNSKGASIKILWGVGSTVRNKFESPTHPSYDGVQLIGIRDYQASLNNKNFNWVPCASCMAKEFDNINPPKQDLVFYGHKKVSPMNNNNNAMNNDNKDFKKVIEHLSLGETVVTSSYHGAYWALLLGRKVVCIPFGSKFFGFKHPPTIVKKYDGQKGLSYDGLLEEYREKNKEYWNKVQCII